MRTRGNAGGRTLVVEVTFFAILNHFDSRSQRWSTECNAAYAERRSG